MGCTARFGALSALRSTWRSGELLPERSGPRSSSGFRVAGAIGGAGGGQILTTLLPMLAGTGGNVDIGSVIGQAAGGGVAGAILTIVVGLIKNTMAK